MAGIQVVFNAIDKISIAFDKMVNSGERLMQVFERTQTSTNAMVSQISAGTNITADAMEQVMGTADGYADAMENMESVTEEAMQTFNITSDGLEILGTSADGVAKPLDSTSDSLGGLGESANKATPQIKDSTDAIGGLDKLLATVGIVAALTSIALGFKDCSNAATEVETNIAIVSTVADESVLSLGAIDSQIRDLSDDTAVSVNLLANATYNAISASVDTADAVAFVGTANQLAVGGFTDSVVAVDVLTTAINAYGLEASEATQISDYLITAQNLGKLTVNELASSIGSVIPLAAAYGVELDNLNASYAVLTSGGINTAQSTTYIKSMLVELADTGSAIAGVLLDETGYSFSALTEQGQSLGDVMQTIGNSVDGDTVAFANLWSSVEAGSGAIALYNAGAEKFDSVLGQMQNSAGATERAYEIMTDTTEHSTQRMTTSFENLKISIGDDINPLIATLQNSVADVVGGFTSFVEIHPEVVAIFTGMTAGVVALTGAFLIYKGVTVASTIATSAFSAAMALNPIGLAVTAIAALVIGLGSFISVIDANIEKTEELSYASQQQANVIEGLNAEYEESVKVYGEASEQTQALANELSYLERQFDDTKQTAEEYNAEIEQVMQSYTDMEEQFKTANEELKSESDNVMSLVNSLDYLINQNDLTEAGQQELSSIVRTLNGEIPNLSLYYDELAGSINMSVDALRDFAAVEIADKRITLYDDELESLGWAKASGINAVDRAKDEAAAIKVILDSQVKNLDTIEANYKKGTLDGNVDMMALWAERYDSEDAFEIANKHVAELEAHLEEVGGDIAIKAGEKSVVEAEKNAIGLVGLENSAEYGATSAIKSMGDELTILATKYDDVYNGSYSSMSGQIGLFNEMKTESELSVGDMQSAMDSQVEYLKLYTENMEKASEYGLNDALLSSMSDGSMESAGQLNEIISSLEKGLSNGISLEDNDMLKNLNDTYEEVGKLTDIYAET